jgi:hypothetical protein
VLVSGSDRGDCEGVLDLSSAESEKGTLVDAHGLCDNHLVLVMRHSIAG